MLLLLLLQAAASLAGSRRLALVETERAGAAVGQLNKPAQNRVDSPEEVRRLRLRSRSFALTKSVRPFASSVIIGGGDSPLRLPPPPPLLRCLPLSHRV